MRLTKILPFLVLILLFFKADKISATHIMGGEITWECQPNGQYIFTLKVYRDCNGVGLNVTNEAIEVHDYPGPGSIRLLPLTFFSVTDITPSCEGSPCATLNRSDPDIPGAIEEYVLRTAPVTLNGIPPANGWTFTWTSGNRNAAIDNINNAQNFGITLRAKMFPYQARNANPCFDSSPDFYQKPSSIICAGEPFTYNHSAFDNELDSLAYSWAQPLDGNACGTRPCQIGGVYQENVNPVNVPFDGGNNYSFTSPFPDATQDPRNVAAVLDPITGEISFTSYNQGEYVSVIRVEAFKCGEKIAEIYRELQTVILAGCASNEPPIIPPPFANGSFSDTVKAGDFVTFDFSIYDTLRPDNPKNDSLFIFGSGQQFGANFTDSTTGCANPPCATLSYPLSDTALGSYSSTLKWQTTCDHIANGNPTCVATQNTYLFVLRAFDDFCPAAGQSVATFSITVLAEELVPHPDIHCADVQANGDVILDWNQTSDPDNSFRQWKIYTSTNRNGPYILIDSIADYNITTYTHVTAGANNQSIHYLIRAESGCHGDWLITPTDTISSMFINPTFNNSCVNLSWNELDSPLPSGSAATYEIFREYPIGSGFNLYTTSTTTNICDSFTVCSDSVTYKIELGNTGNGCLGSSSNIKGIRFQYPAPAIDAGNEIDLCDGQSVQIGGSPSGEVSSTFNWSPNQNINNSTLANPTVTPLDTTTYYLTVTDTLGCTSLDSIKVNVQPTPRAMAGNDTLICIQNLPLDLSGSVSISGTGRWIGGNGNFLPNRNTLNATYQPTNAEINNGQVLLELISTNVGICDPDTDQIIINITRFTSALNVNYSHVSCNGLSNGGIGISANGSNPPYTFTWNTPSGIRIGDTLSNLSAGNYNLTATNGNGCDTTFSVMILEPTMLNATISSTQNSSCNNAIDGEAVVNASGGTAPYTYLWSNNQITDTARNLSAGNYSVTITDANTCTATATTSISEPLPLIANISTGQNVSCNGFNDGKAYVTISGGTTPYTYLWSNNQITDTAQNLIAGNYSVTITDNNSCTAVSSVNITEPINLTASISAANNVSCKNGNNGNATVSANGGTAPYTYLWSNNQTTATANSLSAGNYVVTVTDANQCITTANVSINEPSALSTANTFQVNVSCNGLSDGYASVTPTGGTAPYTYLWSNNQLTDTARNLSSAAYTVTITDNNGCTLMESINISEPLALSVSAQVVQQASCNGFSNGMASANAIGGTGSYTYNWDNTQIGDTARNLIAGTYQVTVTDQNSCTATTSVTISEPATLIGVISSSENVSCNGGNDGWAAVNPQGGTAPYTYLWSNTLTTDTAKNLNAGNYSVTISDQNSCTATTAVIIREPDPLISSISSFSNISCQGLNDGSATVNIIGGTAPYTFLWSNSQNTATASNLTAGNYSVTVTDNNQCTSVESISLSQPAVLISNAGTQINVSCFGLNDGSAKVNVSGGTLPYTYLWSNSQQTDSAVNLNAATYTVTITDANNCTSTTTFNISEPNQVTSTTSIINGVSCTGFSNGQATILASGGTQPYTYNWSNNLNTDTIRGLFAGKYFITLSDANGCSKLDSVELVGPTQLVSSLGNSVDVSCNGGSDGFAYVNVSGGTQPYTYSWSNNSSTDTIRNLAANTYILTLTDANGCNSGTSVIINEPSPLSIVLSTKRNVSCQGLSNGEAYATVSGGTLPYTYLWSNNVQNDTIRNLTAGNYSVTITDGNACTISSAIAITEPNTLISTIASPTHVSCFGGNDGSAFVSFTGGTSPITYLWSNGETSNTNSSLSTGIYYVTISDANGCVDSSNVFISEPTILATTTQITSPISCNNAANGVASVNPSGGTLPYTYLWSQGSSSSSITNLSIGMYYVTVTDGKQCSKIDSIQLTQPQVLSASISNSKDVSCFGLSDGQASVLGTGGTTPYTYFWSNNKNTNSIQNVVAGTYGVTITDARGCQASSNVVINQPALLSLTLNGSHISCFGEIDGQITSSQSGGSSPYSYKWSNGSTTPLINGLSAGKYLLTLSDLNNCQVVDSFTIQEPQAITLNSLVDDTVCINVPKSILVQANGGTGAYTYQWNQNLGNGSSISVTPQQETTYRVSVTDSNACPEAIEELTLSVRDIANDDLNIYSSGNICRGDSSLISVVFNGSIGPFTYNWQQNLNGIQDQYVQPLTTTTYILEVVDICNNSLSDSVVVAVSSPPSIALNDTLIEGCEDFRIRFNNQTPTNYLYRWDFGDGNTSSEAIPENTYTEPGTYLVKLKVSTTEGCESTSEANYRVRVLPSPIADIFANPTETDIENANINLSGDFTDANYWRWNFGDGEDTVKANNFIYTYADTGTYILSLIERNSFNCYDTNLLRIRINPNYEIKIPNVFIPNTNGSNGGTYNPNSNDNSVFHPFLEYVEDYHLMIFNRWGELMFESKDVNIGWDGYYKGKLCQADVYVYKMEVEFINGDRATKVGDVTLLR